MQSSRILASIGRRIEQSGLPLAVRLWDGATTGAPHPQVTITVRHPLALTALGRPTAGGLAARYVEQQIDVDGPIRDVVGLGTALSGATVDAPAASARWLASCARHTRLFDSKSIRSHYDVSDDFFGLWLDRRRVYSCAYYRRADDTLEIAQEQKLDHICRKLRLASGERFLDIGCGWGALIMWAAERYGVEAVGVTLSRNQHDYARARIRDLGLEGRCEVRLLDYRDVPETRPFDKIASVGMFEHVGLRHLKAYFEKIRCLLDEGGLVLNHGITATDPDSRWVGLGAGEFVSRYVFPHGELPHLSVVLRETASADLEVADVESLRRHYARTCLEWARRLEQNREQAIAAAGDKRYRIWQVYLAGCAHGFEHEWMNIYQVLARKEGGASNPLPLTRDYMYRSE